MSVSSGVALRFRPDPARIAWANEQDEFIRNVAYEYHHFMMPIRFMIDGDDVLLHYYDWEGERHYDSELESTLLYIGPQGLSAVREACRTGHSRLTFIEGERRLDFTAHGGVVTVKPTLTNMIVPDRQFTTTCAALLQAWEAFCNDIRAYLLAEVPRLAEHPFWERWLAGEDYEDIPFDPFIPADDPEE